MTPHATLRVATRAAHERVDAAFAALDLGHEDDYREFLGRHAAAFLPIEQALDEAGAGRLIGGWDKLRRTPALLADLADLGMATPPPRSPPAYPSDAAILGGAYVLEGSRLGGAVLRQAVGSALPRQFLDAVQPSGRWREFIAQLNQSLYDPEALNCATDAALDTFALFQ
ncbi:MAG: biliverdin-producing heme oxygenase [Sphingomicrobium sp.]